MDASDGIPDSRRRIASAGAARAFFGRTNVPYTRYFLADILQFQFHRELSKIAGCKTPLHRCSIYDSKDAGMRLNAMLSLGLSRPWQDALETMTGSRQMDATAIIDYFAPLKTWLDEQIKGKPVGWE